MFVVIGGLASLFFLFNTGQLSQEKTKLVNTADAVAYSAGVMHARALNFIAYGNRALVANEVLVGQMVSLSSWAHYARTHAQNLPTQFAECADPYGYGATLGAAFHYGPEYAVMCYLTVQYAGDYIAQIAEQVPPLAQAVVTGAETNKQAIKLAHGLLHTPGHLQSMRAAVMQDVAQANYAGDGSVRVEPAGLVGASGVPLTDDWGGFTRPHCRPDPARIADLARPAAPTDPFTRERRWDAPAAFPGPDPVCIDLGRKREVRRRGGTELANTAKGTPQATKPFCAPY